ncbi:ferric-chelate reductase 1-like [Haliotis rufescens]|uniref:ferric-chelate reductase 1-like n=1 Tax=Haliotis rufescens TaxID=6454 RepID=UPI00201FA426|nr:ferric-chelate reductase 1-like [Haliotis rufescens]
MTADLRRSHITIRALHQRREGPDIQTLTADYTPTTRKTPTPVPRSVPNRSRLTMAFTSCVCSLLVLLGMLGKDAAYPQGANEMSCAQLLPGHGKEVTHTKPYSLLVNRLTVYPGDTIKVTIEGTKSFKGFLVKTVNTQTGNTIGYSIPGSNMGDRCGKSGVTHKDGRIPKNRRTFDWVAPSNANAGTVIQFRSVIVEEKRFYYYVNSANVVIVSRPITQAPTTPKPRPPVGGFTFGISNERQAGNSQSRDTNAQPHLPREITGIDGSPQTAEQIQKEITRVGQITRSAIQWSWRRFLHLIFPNVNWSASRS